MTGDEYKIVPVHGHWEAYINGEFYCSADTISEAASEIEKAMNNE